MRVLEINSGEDLEKALERLDEIWTARPGDTDWDERRELVERITAYEDANIHIPPPDPVDAILFRMEQAGLAQKDLIPYIGSASKVSEVLDRKRNLSKAMIRRLHAGFGIPAASLLGLDKDVPAGFELVEWVLPNGVVAKVTEDAQSFGVSVSEAAAMLIMTVAWRSGSPVVIENKDAALPHGQDEGPLLGRSVSESEPVLTGSVRVA